MLRTLITLALASSLSAQVTYYSAKLDAQQEVPPTASSAVGYGIVRIEEPANSVRIWVHHVGLSGAPTSGHLHQGAVGANGGIIAVMTAAAGTNVMSGSATLSAAQIALIKSGNTYLNLHTATLPGGEIRGQVVAPVSTRLEAELDGAQEVPPTSSTATGRAIAFLHEPDNRLVYCVETTGLGAVTAGHVHRGAVGTNGAIMVPMVGSGGTFCGVSDILSAADAALVLAGDTYTNVHTTAFPGGEIRGQLRSASSDFTAFLDAAQEVPPTSSTGIGTASAQLDKSGVLNVKVNYSGLSSTPVSGHIHFAPIGSNGPITQLLTLGTGTATASFTPTATQLAQIRAGDWYVNMHTASFPGGEIRGQLGPVELPTTFGAPCPGGSGSRPEIGATGFAAPGASFDADLYGAAPTTGAFLALGFSRDAGIAGPLPLPFATVGIAAPCFVFADPLAALLSFTDGNGCATRQLSFGYVPSVLGLGVYAQWLVLDGGAAGGVNATNGLSMTLQ